MRIARTRTALLRTSTASDVKRSGQNVEITGLESISYKDIIKISQFKYRAEVVKLETIGADTPTILASTSYIVEISDPTGRREGMRNSLVPRRYSYTTPADLTQIGATAALQREYVYGKLITEINNDTANNVVAVSLAGGTGFTIADDAGYYPPKTTAGQGPRGGASIIYLPLDRNGRGFIDASERVITTNAIYQFGEGTRLVQDVPMVYALGGGNIVSGELDCPMTIDGLPPVAGQHYDAFAIDSLISSEIPTVGEVRGYREQNNIIFVDNGTGSATTNLTGFGAFEKSMLRLLFSLYENNPLTVVDFFDNIPSFTGKGTAGIPTGSDGDTNGMNTGKTGFTYYIKGASTQIFPLWDFTNGGGLIMDLDNSAEGLEISPPVVGDKQIFVVGKQQFSLYYKGTITDVSQANPFYVGFRKKAAYNTAISGYTDYAALGFNASAATQLIKTLTNLASAGEVATDTLKTWADTESHVFEVRVLLDGTVKFFVDNVDVSSKQTVAYVFTAGTTVIPFVRAIATGSGAPANTMNAFVAIPTATWKINQ